MDDIQSQNSTQPPQAPAEQPQPSTSSPIQPQVSSVSPKKKSKTVLLVILALLLVIGAAAGGWYYGTNQAQKKADAQVASLNAKIADLQKANTTLQEKSHKEIAAKDTASDTKLSSADITALDKALTAACNKDATNQIYIISDASGKTYTKITAAVFSKVGQNGEPNYYKNTVIINVSCRDAAKPDEANGGYVAVLQRQSDGSWKQVLGFQDTPSCDVVKQYSISNKIIPTCVEQQGSKEVSNTIQ